MKNSTPLFTLSIIAAGVIAACRFVTHAGEQSGTNINSLGVARTAATTGERVTVDVLGTAIVETGAAIAAGAAIETDATGRAITKNLGVTVARLAPGEVATAAGQFVEVLLIPN